MYKKLSIKIIFFGFCFVLQGLFSNVQAQFYTGSQMDFGRKRVQYESFFWSYYRFNGFDVYYTKQGRNLASYTASYVKRHLPDFEEKIGYSIQESLRFIVFNRLSDYKQNNIGYVDENNYNTGGVTRFLDNKVFLYFTGDYETYELQIRQGIASLLLEQAIYGTKLGTQYKNSYLMSLPVWFRGGLASYYAKDWDIHDDEQMREAILQKRFKYIAGLEGEEADFAGHSFWHFIAQTYGKDAVARCVKVVASERSLEKTFTYALNVKYKDLMKAWSEYYKKQDTELVRDSLPEGHKMKRTRKPERRYDNFVLSPDQSKAAYVSNYLGKACVYIYHLNTKKRKRIYKLGAAINDKPDYSYPVLEWHPNSEILGIVHEGKGLSTLVLYDVNKKKKEAKVYNMEAFQKILDFSFSDNGRLIALSGVKEAYSDIYLYYMGAASTERLSFDIYDDKNVEFVKGEESIVFSSNRPDDTLRQKEKYETAPSLGSDFKLYMYDLKTRPKVLTPLVKNEHTRYSMPRKYKDDSFAFLHNENGITNLALGDIQKEIAFIDTSIHYRNVFSYKTLSDYRFGIKSLDITSQKKAEIYRENGRYVLLISPFEEAKKMKAVKPKPTDYKLQWEEELRLNKLAFMREDSIRQADSSFFEQELKAVLADTAYVPKLTPYKSPVKLRMSIISDVWKEEGGVYEKEEITKLLGISDSTQTRVDSLTYVKGLLPPKQHAYRVEYSINEATAQLGFSFLNSSYQQFTNSKNPIYFNSGTTGLFKISISDLMENHRMIGGFSFAFDFSSMEYLFSYENLERRFGHQFVFHYQSLKDNSAEPLRQSTIDAYYIMKYPFTEVSLAKATVFGRFDRNVYRSYDYQSLVEKNRQLLRGGLKLEWIYDHSRWIAQNIYYGTRGKVWGEFYQGIWNVKDQIFVFGADFRNYQRLYKTLIWANRVAVSTSFGSSRLIYYMGGVDNWLLPRFNRDVEIDPKQNYAYQTLATNMRGFTQNIRNGNTFAVLNSEIRFPVFACLSKTPLKNAFLRNFQILAFGDIGSAWSGWNPWSKDNQFYKKTIEGNPIHIVLEKDANPIVGGFGCGLRTEILGYFIRADVAWGVENSFVRKPVFYLSFTTDF